MSWVTNKIPLINLLESSGYARIPDNLVSDEADKSQEDFTYSLQLGEADTQELSSGMTLNSDRVELVLSYFNSSNEEYDENYDNFVSVCSSIKDLTNFNGIDEIRYERTSPETSRGYFTFYFGDYIC